MGALVMILMYKLVNQSAEDSKLTVNVDRAVGRNLQE